MKREILNHKRMMHINGCCPGHDDWPNETYRNNRSKKARANSIKREHRWVRRLIKLLTKISLDKSTDLC